MFKTVAVAALAAPQISVLNVKQFVSGLIYGITGDNVQAEVEKCLQNGDVIAKDIQTAFNDFKKGDLADIVIGAAAIARIVQELPADLSQCESISNVVGDLIAWAEVFKNPATAVEVGTFNAFLHTKECIGDTNAAVANF